MEYHQNAESRQKEGGEEKATKTQTAPSVTQSFWKSDSRIEPVMKKFGFEENEKCSLPQSETHSWNGKKKEQTQTGPNTSHQTF